MVFSVFCVNQFIYIIWTNVATQRVFFSYFWTLLLSEINSFDNRGVNERMNMNEWLIVSDRTKLKYSQEYLSQRHFVYHKSHMDRPHAKAGHWLSKIKKRFRCRNLLCCMTPFSLVAISQRFGRTKQIWRQ
jgi:hypothetical protein